LIYVGYTFIESEDDLQGLFSFVSFLILVVAGLGIVQSIIGPSFLNPAHLQEDIRELSTLYRSSSSGLAYRPSSVFVSAGRFQDFLVVAWIVSLGHTSYLMLRHCRGRMLAFTALAVVAGASLMSTSRGVFMWNVGIALLFAVGLLWGAPWRQSEAIRVLRITFRVILFSGSAIALLIVLFPEAVRSRLEIYYNTLMPTSPNSELVLRSQTYPMQQLRNAFDSPRWVYGNGTGTSSLGLQYVSRIMGAPPTPGGSGESGFGNLIAELGILGLGLWLALGLAIVISAWKVVTKLRGTPWLPLVLAIFVYAIVLCFLMTFSGFSYQDFLMNAYFWLLLGILYRLKLFPRALQIAHP
jgi:O-antigen ligase